MDFELPEELTGVQKLARDFSEKEIAPNATKDDKEHIFRKDLVTKMGPLGFFGDLRGRTVPNFFGHSTVWPEFSAGLSLSWGER